MTEVQWSRKAISDLEAIRAYISRDSIRYAKAVTRALVLRTDQLEQQPRSGRVVPEVGDENLRELIWKRYRIVYRLRESVAEVVTVHDSARDFPKV